jgi:transposase
LNANLVHKWRSRPQAAKPATVVRSPVIGEQAGGGFVALQLPAERAPAAAADIRIELRRGATVINIAWPTEAAGECAAWLGQWLR